MKSPARRKLKDAASGIAAATGQVTELRTAVVAAKRTVADAEADLKKYDDLEAEIVKFRIAATRKGGDPKKLPDGLANQVKAKRAAVEELERAATTLDAISKDFDRTELELRALSGDRIKFVVAALREFVTPLVDELNALNARRIIIADLLNGLAETYIQMDGRMQFIGFTVEMHNALNPSDGASSAFPGGINVRGANAKRWQQRIDALIADPDAQISIPQLVKPSDIILGREAPGGFNFARQYELRPEA